MLKLQEFLKGAADERSDGLGQSGKLRRSLTTPLLTLYGLGVTVGAGVYVLVETTAAEAGVYAPVSFLIVAIVVAFTAFSYAELSTRYPVSAGEAAYLEAGFGSGIMAIVTGLAVALSGTVSAAAVIIASASYHQGLMAAPHAVLPIGIVVLMGLIAIWGITQSITALAERTSQIVLFVFMLVNVALIRIKLRGDDGYGHFAAPIAVPVLGVLTSLLLFATAWL